MTDDDDLLKRDIGKGSKGVSIDSGCENDDEDISDQYGAVDEGFEDDREIFQENNSDDEDPHKRETGSDSTDVPIDSDCENDDEDIGDRYDAVDEEFEEDLFKRNIGKGSTGVSMDSDRENDDDEEISDQYGAADEGFEDDHKIFQENNSDK